MQKTAKSKAQGGKPTQRQRRGRFGNLPQPPEVNETPYGKERKELKGLSCGELTKIVLESKAFKEEIGAICAKLDSRPGTRGPGRRYTSLECEIVFVYQRVCGLRSVKEARDRLAGDRGADARVLFGLDRKRETNGKRVRKLRDGIPSDSTLSRHRKRFGERRRRGGLTSGSFGRSRSST